MSQKGSMVVEMLLKEGGGGLCQLMQQLIHVACGKVIEWCVRVV